MKTKTIDSKDIKNLIENNQIAEAEALCVDALNENPFNEDILELHLRVLLLQGKNTEAYQEYKRMETMYYEVMRLSFSEKLRKLYNQIQRATGDEELPLEDMLETWIKAADFPGAFYCDLGIFKTVYQIEARNARRSGKSTFIVRIDTKHELGDRRVGVMKKLGMAIPGNLRKGDLFTRTSPNQYMLMLHNLSYENCKMLVDRILRSLDTKRLARISGTTIKPLTPIEG